MATQGTRVAGRQVGAGAPYSLPASVMGSRRDGEGGGGGRPCRRQHGAGRGHRRQSGSTMPGHHGLETTTGRGLHLLDSLTSRWGTELSARAESLWFEINALADARHVARNVSRPDLSHWPDLEDFDAETPELRSARPPGQRWRCAGWMTPASGRQANLPLSRPGPGFGRGPLRVSPPRARSAPVEDSGAVRGAVELRRSGVSFMPEDGPVAAGPRAPAASAGPSSGHRAGRTCRPAVLSAGNARRRRRGGW